MLLKVRKIGQQPNKFKKNKKKIQNDIMHEYRFEKLNSNSDRASIIYLALRCSRNPNILNIGQDEPNLIDCHRGHFEKFKGRPFLFVYLILKSTNESSHRK